MESPSDLLVVVTGFRTGITVNTQMVTHNQGRTVVDRAKAWNWSAEVIAINPEGEIVAEHFPQAPSLDDVDN